MGGIRGLFKSLGKRFSRTTAIVVVVAGGLATQFGIHVYPRLGDRSYPEALSLAGDWEVCLPRAASIDGCAWQMTTVPQDLPSRLKVKFTGFIAYQREFTTPASCLGSESSCVLFLGEVGDAVEASLNGVSLGRRGSFPPEARYAKHYPATFDLSRDLLRSDGKPNRLSLLVYSMKRVQAGVRRGPVAILDSKSAASATQAFVLVSILIPLFAALGLLLLGLSPLVLGFKETLSDSPSQAYIRFCFAACAFLLSFSEIPREYYPIWLAGYLHFFLRVLFDYAYFALVAEFFDFKGPLIRASRLGYALTLATFGIVMGAQYLLGDLENAGFGFDSAFLICRIALPLLLLPHAMGLYGALRNGQKRGSRLLASFFAVLLGLQIHDSLIFHGYLKGSYAVKAYPFAIGLVFGAMLLKRRQEALRKLEVAARVGCLAEQVAHDIRSPLSALRVASSDLGALPEESRELIAAAIARIQAISAGLIQQNRTLDGSPEVFGPKPQVVSLSDSLERILAEKRLQYREREALHIETRLPDPSAPVLAKVDETEFQRIISNLVNNSVEASGERGRIEANLEKSQGRARITISDDGKGIPKELLSQLGGRGVSFGKAHGSGLGLHHAKTHLEAWGGGLKIASQPGRGTQVVIEIPLHIA